MAATDAIASLDALDRSLLHVFVAGPGQGEGIAVALPGRGWLLVDGCRTAQERPGRDLPLGRILERWRAGAGEPVCAMVLSHPHLDHAEGIAELVERLEPDRVCVAGSRAPGVDLLTEARLWRQRLRDAGTTEQSRRISVVLGAIRAFEAIDRRRPGALLVAHDGVKIPAAGSPASIEVRAPDDTACQSFFHRKGLEGRLPARANRISLVVEVSFGETRLVLGGDLPWKENGTVLARGWGLVMERHRGLAAHHGLKVPHHGSTEALHPDLVAPATRRRTWLVTPFNSSSLPSLARSDGLDLLLEAEPSVLLTALPASKHVQTAHAGTGRVTLADIASRTDAVRQGRSFLVGALDHRPGTALGPLDPVWCVAFDDAGRVRGRWRGPAAIEVVR